MKNGEPTLIEEQRMKKEEALARYSQSGSPFPLHFPPLTSAARWITFMLIIILHSSFLILHSNAQTDSLLFERNYHVDSLSMGELAVEIDNVSFFKDNEYDGISVTGYTLPGLWIQPKATYQPLQNLTLELGFHSLIYAGKVKYPNSAYQDLPFWKGQDYTSGTHILPFFRANLQMGKIHVVLGNIYGGRNHHLIEPLHSRELNLTSDPEMGLQFIADLNHWHLDTWVNWQSFIFKTDTHQEAFTYGGNSELKFGRWTVPLQVVLQHRGGEIQKEDAHVGVQTVINGAGGVRYEQPIDTRWLTKVTVETEGTLYVQQSGKLFGYDNGWGIYAHSLFDFKPGIRFDLGYFHSDRYVPVFGDGHYSSINTNDRSVLSGNVNTLSAGLEWSRSFSKNYAFGCRAEAYYVSTGRKNAFDFNFGVFLKANPRFLIKKF